MKIQTDDLDSAPKTSFYLSNYFTGIPGNFLKPFDWPRLGLDPRRF